MCPPASALTGIDINVSSSDEDVMRFLSGGKAGDPLPSNFITGVNPFSLEPWDASAEGWYLYNTENGFSHEKLSTFRATKIGFWRLLDHLTVSEDNATSGRKFIWEFHIGREPVGERTGWLMHDYHCEGNSTALGWSSMCRIFLLGDCRESSADKKSPDTEISSPLSSDNAVGELVESMLLRFLEQEEGSQTGVVNQNEVRAGEPDLLTSDSTGDLHAFVELSKGEFLELKDLYDSESTSSSSTDDSSLNSRNSDECFEADAMLRDDESHAIIRLPQTSGSNKIEERMLAGSPPSGGYSPTTSDRRFGAGASASGCCLHDHPKRTHSECSESGSSSNGSGSKSVGRMARFGKKYCCFSPF